MTSNVKAKPTQVTHERGPAKRINAEQQLRRSVMSCLLFEKEFYEDGITIADRIRDLVGKVPRQVAASIAMEARSVQNLRHVPLLIATALADLKFKNLGNLLSAIIQRPDELTEFLSIYWAGADRTQSEASPDRDKGKPLSAQVKKGLAEAFKKFSEYQLSKYKQIDKAIKLRDIPRLVRPKPENEEQSALWKKLIDGSLEAPDTWEVALSGGKDKKETWIRLMEKKKLGGLATLRNLRNMEQAGVNRELIQNYLGKMNVRRILPFRFIAAARAVPALEPALETAMFRSLSEANEGLHEITLLLVDVSGSMEERLSAKSDMTRMDAAAGLAMIMREICANIRIFTFSERMVEIAPRRGFALRDAIVNSQEHSSTYLGNAVKALKMLPHDRIVVITDEQAHDYVGSIYFRGDCGVDAPRAKGYMINVASAKNGVGYGKWIHCDGWSEAVVKWIIEYEKSFK